MINNTNKDILSNDYKDRMYNYFNPYVYNFENNRNENINSDIKLQKSKSHIDRSQSKINK